MGSTLTDCRARDLMKTKVISLVSTAPVREAIETFEEYHISGAPVTNEGGKLVGVLSAFDIAKSEHLREGRLATERGEYYFSNPLGEEFEEPDWREVEFYGRDDYDDTMLGRETVGDWMTPNVISTDPDASMKDVCETMRTEGIHRLLVMEDERLVGIISTYDIVRYLAENL